MITSRMQAININIMEVLIQVKLNSFLLAACYSFAFDRCSLFLFNWLVFDPFYLLLALFQEQLFLLNLIMQLSKIKFKPIIRCYCLLSEFRVIHLIAPHASLQRLRYMFNLIMSYLPVNILNACESAIRA